MNSAPRSLILMYHRIASVAADPWGLCVEPDTFSAHLQIIRQYAAPISLTDYIRVQASGDFPDRSVIITFDDGYLDNYLHALPLLQRHRIPATFFLTTCNIDTDREFWWDRLETLLLAPGQLPTDLQLQLPTGRRHWRLGDAETYTDDQQRSDRGIITWRAEPGTRLEFFYQVWEALSALRPPERDAVIDELTVWAGFSSYRPSSRRSMSSREIMAMGQSEGVTIGAHTVDHPMLPGYPESEQLRQMQLSRKRLEEIIAASVTTFAYPHGAYSQETVRAVRDAGFECAVTVEQKLVVPNTDPMLLPRFGVKDMPGDAFQRQLDAWFELAPDDAGAATHAY